jgi:hypothetical protein
LAPSFGHKGQHSFIDPKKTIEVDAAISCPHGGRVITQDIAYGEHSLAASAIRELYIEEVLSISKHEARSPRYPKGGVFVINLECHHCIRVVMVICTQEGRHHTIGICQFP